VKRLLYLVVVALVALMIFVPAATAQEMTAVQQKETTVTGNLPKSGGAPVGSLVLPAGALLVGSGVLAYAVLRRR
jgi:hypothetical protein